MDLLHFLATPRNWECNCRGRHWTAQFTELTKYGHKLLKQNLWSPRSKLQTAQWLFRTCLAAEKPHTLLYLLFYPWALTLISDTVVQFTLFVSINKCILYCICCEIASLKVADWYWMQHSQEKWKHPLIMVQMVLWAHTGIW